MPQLVIPLDIQIMLFSQVRQERDALEAMRVDFEHELQHAQTEVAKAQDALKTAEDRVRASEQVERQKIISGNSAFFCKQYTWNNFLGLAPQNGLPGD